MIRALKHFAKEHNLVFGTLSPFNEPGSPAWIAPIACQEGCYFNHKRMNDVSPGRGGLGPGRLGGAAGSVEAQPVAGRLPLPRGAGPEARRGPRKPCLCVPLPGRPPTLPPRPTIRPP
jgi:hypothetical protein